MADYTIALEGASDEAFSADVLSGVFVVLGAKPFPTQARAATVKWGDRAANTTTYIMGVRIVGEIVPLAEFGTIIELTRIVYSKHLRILATGTDLPARTFDDTDDDNFWTDATNGWVKDDRPMVRLDFVTGEDFESGADTWNLTLRDVDPNTAPIYPVPPP